jgi:RimJ/RimL family protein N-acetyltransferase
MPILQPLHIRPLKDADSITELTALVRAAYKQLGEMGFRYWGTWQSEDDTGDRCAEGHCLVAEQNGELIGTVTVRNSFDLSDPDWSREPSTWIVGQFAVRPDSQRSGIGSRLMTEAERHAFENGGTECAIDTAEGAAHLIDYYHDRGYRKVGMVDWDGTNYVSVVMSKRLRPTLTTERTVLRDLTLEDIETIKSHWSDPRYQRLSPPGRLTPEHAQEIFVSEVARLNNYPRTGHHWAIDIGGKMSGTARLTFERSQTASIGYGLAADLWGKGLASEVVREVLRYGFEECGLHRIQAFVFSPNDASKRVLQKAGFTHEGALREKIEWGDKRVDDEIFGLLRSEWLNGGR